jgi:hypothetical protein
MKTLQISRSFSMQNGSCITIKKINMATLTLLQVNEMRINAWRKVKSCKGTDLEDKYKRIYDRCILFYKNKFKSELRKQLAKLK